MPTLIRMFCGVLAACFLGPVFFCGVVATLDRGDPFLAGVLFLKSWVFLFHGTAYLLPSWFERHHRGVGTAIAIVLSLATAVLFLPNVLGRVR